MNFRKAVLTLTIFVALAGIHLFIYTQNINLKFKVNDLKIRFNELRSKNRQLGSKVAQRENLAYIEKVAKQKLDMIYPKEINYILVTPESEAH